MSRGLWIVVGVLVALVLGVVVVAWRIGQKALDIPQAQAPIVVPAPSEQVLPDVGDAPRQRAAVPAMPVPRPTTPAAPAPARREVPLGDMESFKRLAGEPFPTQKEWEGFLSRADQVAKEFVDGQRERMDRQIQDLHALGDKANLERQALKTQLIARRQTNQAQFEDFQKQLDGVYRQSGDKRPAPPPEVFAKMVENLVRLRAENQVLEDHINKL
ncbi:MAG: hypothetical protein HYY13_04545 [Nitrospirae bacterium]|nr:hypothetical protein [Nitrospirota bacterium]